MPLLRRKPFVVKQPPENLTAEDEVFFFQLTGEVFTDYDEFFERVILCNSLLWTCECTGRNGLTYKEACESEDQIRETLRAIADATKRAVLELVHQTKRSRIGDISEEIIDYLKNRYQDGESVEIKIKDEWKKCVIRKAYGNNHPTRSPNTPKSPKSSGKKGTPSKGSKKSDSKSPVSPIDTDSSFWFSPLDCEYDIKVIQDDSSPKLVKGKQLRRQKGSLTKDLVRLLLRQTCKRTTASSDDGYWVVEPQYIAKYALEESLVPVGPLSLETPLKLKQKRKRSSNKQDQVDGGKSPAKKRKSMENSKSPKTKADKEKNQEPKLRGKRKSVESKKSPEKKTKFREQQKQMTPGKKKKILEKMKMKELAEKDKQKKKRLLQREKEREKMKKDKEEEKQKKKIEKEREKEKTSVIRKMEIEFTREWSRHKDDLKLEDLKELPCTSKINTQIQGDLFGDVLMVVEFLNIFGTFYDIKDAITQKITYEVVEKAVLEHDAEGLYYDIVKFLLQTFLNILKEENEEDNADEESTHGTTTPEEQEEIDQMQEEEVASGKVSSNATAAAAWPMLHQGMALDELTIDPFSLSEVFRLHVLSSGVKIGGARNLWQKKGGFQFTDDPCVDFRHKEKSVMTTLHTSCLYDLPTQDKLKVLCVLCNQILTLSTTRDYIEDSFYKVKELKRKLRELQNKEQKRRKFQSAERWKRRMEECVKRREEIEKQKKEKEEREGEAKALKSPVTETVEKKKKGRPKKSPAQSSQESTTEQLEPSASQESKEEHETEGNPENLAKKEEQTAEEKEEEQRIREEYRKEEKELVDEISNYAVVCSEVPLGLDRIYNRYWSLKHVNGLLVENDEEGQKLAAYVGEDDSESNTDLMEDNLAKVDGEKGDANDATEVRETDFPQVTLSDIKNARSSREQLCRSLFMRYKCELNDDRLKLLSESKTLSLIIDNVAEGIDSMHYASKPINKWSVYSASSELDDLMTALNNRGLREDMFKTKLEKMTDKLHYSIDNCTLLRQSVTDSKPAKPRSSKGDTIVDKALFKTMDDFLEANLRDQLLEIEERVWQAGLGILKTEDRQNWRDSIASRINQLLMGPVESKVEPDSVLAGEIVKNDDVNVGDNIDSDDMNLRQHGGDDDVKDDCLPHEIDSSVSAFKNGPAVAVDGNSDKKLEKQEIAGKMGLDALDVSENGLETSVSSLKSFPLKFLEQNGLGEDSSRCTTPVNISTPLVNSQVKELAKVLMQVKNGIDRKYLTPPLGEDEDTKKERIREMIEAAHAEFNGAENSANNKGKRTSKKEAATDNRNESESTKNDDADSVTSSEEDLKKERTCLERWETSLMAATNFSQIFIHLNTLDRSIMWDKSVLNARCRLCRKKGDAEKMLLCDGCDRGFHMYCLKPPVKKIPDGDWFCADCRPKEQRRGQRARKRPTKLEEFVNAIDDLSDDGNNVDVDEDEGSENVEDSDDAESSDEEPIDNHSDFCSVCNVGGDLLCCDLCSRSFHVNCSYPPIRKAPKGDWSCQVCTGADSDLPKARRVSSLERQREKADTLLAKELSRKQSKSSVSQRISKRVKKRSHSLPGPGPSKKQKLISEKSEERSRKQTGKSSRKSTEDPTSHSSRRQSDVFGRYERRICSKILEELIASDGAEPFLLPVDVKMVTDYLDFIDNPTDLSTIKRNLNNSVYDSLDKFIGDIRLMFLNCETYNPPRSPVARAGSRLSMYFEQRLQELDMVVT